jgi:adenosine/AMP kinase
MNMFGAFRSIDYQSIRARTPSDAAVKRLDGIGHVLSNLEQAGVQTQDDLTRMLLTLDTADKCIRAIRAEFRTEAASDRLIRKAENLMELIERARDELTGCRAAKS